MGPVVLNEVQLCPDRLIRECLVQLLCKPSTFLLVAPAIPQEPRIGPMGDCVEGFAPAVGVGLGVNGDVVDIRQA